MNTHQVVIGFDFGTKRIGLAIGQTYLKTAQELKSLNTVNNLPNESELKKIIIEWQPDLAVIGKPASASKSFIKKLNRLANYLSEQHQLDSCFVDETLTTEQANFEMYVANTKVHQKQQQRDSIAARLIIETFFETLNFK